MQVIIQSANTKFEQGFNCAQSVFASFAPSMGLSEALALKIATPFGGGIRRMGEVCGAVSGAMMVIGLKFGNLAPDNSAGKELNNQLAQDFAERFTQQHGTILCRQLLNLDISNPEELELARQAGLFSKRCPLFVQSAAEILTQLLTERSIANDQAQN